MFVIVRGFFHIEPCCSGCLEGSHMMRTIKILLIHARSACFTEASILDSRLMVFFSIFPSDSGLTRQLESLNTANWYSEAMCSLFLGRGGEGGNPRV